MFFTMSQLDEMEFPEMPNLDSINLEQLREYIGSFELENGTTVSQNIDLSKRRPLLIAGELANPYRLCLLYTSPSPRD